MGGDNLITRAWNSTTSAVGGGISTVFNKAGRAVGNALGWAGGKIADGASSLAKGAVDLGGDMLSSDFMKKYGYAGAVVFLYMMLFKGSGWKQAGLVATIAGGLFGKFLNPMLSKVFNSSAAGETPETQPRPTPADLANNSGFVGQGPSMLPVPVTTYGVPTTFRPELNNGT